MLKYSPDGTGFMKTRIGLQCVGSLFTLIGLCLIASAMFMSGWQVAYLDNNSAIFEHGLYRDCVRGQDNIRPVDQWVCFWKYDQNNHIETDRFFKFRDYQESVLAIFGTSIGLAVLTIICCCGSCGTRICNIPWAVSALLTATLAAVGIIVFERNASISDNRFIRMDNYEMDMWLGSSFYITIGGIVAHCVAALLAIVCGALAFTEMRQQQPQPRRSVYAIPDRSEKITVTTSGKQTKAPALDHTVIHGRQTKL